MIVDTSAWTEEGSLAAALIEALRQIDAIAAIRVEDAPASRAESGYAFISTEVFVSFDTSPHQVTVKRFGIRWPRTIIADRMTLEQLGAALGAVEGIGPPDYADQGLLQYLRTERIVPPYQTKGTKVIEMVRIYCVR